MKKLLLIFLLLPLLLKAQISQKKKAFIIASSGSTSEPPYGYDYLIANAKAGWNFETLTGAEDAAVTTSADLTGHGYTAGDNAGGNTPKVGYVQAGTTLKASLKGKTSSGVKDAFITALAATNLFNSDFEVDIKFVVTDGIIGAANYLIGSSNGGTQRFDVAINTAGNIQIRIAMGASLSTFTATGNPLSNDYTGDVYLNLRADFTNDILSVSINGIPLTVALTSGGAFSTINPASFNVGVRALGIGGTWDGSFAANATVFTFIKQVWITPLKSDLERLYVSRYLIPNSGKVYPFWDAKTQPIVEGSAKTFSFAIGDTAPSGNVTASLSSENGYFTVTSSLTFTSGNYLTPQSVTLTGITSGTVQGVIYDNLIISLSGGGYSYTKKIPIMVTDTGLDENFLKGYNWRKDITITSESQIATKRAALIDFAFNGNGLPTNAVPASSTIGYTGLIYAGFASNYVGASSINRHVFTTTDVDGYTWTHVNYHFLNSGGNGKLVMVCRGHGSEAYSIEMTNQLLAAGYSVWSTAMPDALENTETNPTITGAAVNAHNDMFAGGLDRVGYNPLGLFFFDKIMSLNYLDANYSYTEYSVTGCSGGGWTSAHLMAMDTRITKGIHVRGFKPWLFTGFSDEALSSRDYEQYFGTGSGPRLTAFITSTVTHFDIIALAGSNNRVSHFSNHAADACCHNKFTFNLWSAFYKSYLSSLNCGLDVTLNTNASYTTHGWNVNDRALIATILN